jgi:hypothetical protein
MGRISFSLGWFFCSPENMENLILAWLVLLKGRMLKPDYWLVLLTQEE